MIQQKFQRMQKLNVKKLLKIKAIVVKTSLYSQIYLCKRHKIRQVD